MKIHFRLYKDAQNDFTSSIFDLIDGDRETKQTKGLAYIFSQNYYLLFDFLNLREIRERIQQGPKLGFAKDTVTSIEVSAERTSAEKKRADIVIKIEVHQKPFVAIIIEAKSIKSNDNSKYTSEQIKRYLNPTQFPDLDTYYVFGVTLTKYNHCIPEFVNLTWEDIVRLIFNFTRKQNKTIPIINQYN